MKRRLMKSLLAAACLAAPLAAAPAQAQVRTQNVEKPTSEMVLSVGRGQLVTLPAPVRDLFITDDNIVDVQVKSERQLYVFGKAGGETTIYASDAAGNVVWSTVARVGSNIESVDQMLRLAMPDAKVAVSTMGTGTVLLTGTVATPEDAAEAQRLVQAFLGDKANVITRVKMATPLQVNLQVRFAEVSRSLVREMATNVATRDSSGGFLFGLSRGRNPGNWANSAGTISGIPSVGLPVVDASSVYGLPQGTISLPFDPVTGKFVVNGQTVNFAANNSSQSAIGLAGKLFGLDIIAGLDLAERIGLVTTLSQPNLTALSGETADFLAGGEFPIPISQGLGTTSIEYRKYGVSLSYTPIVLANGRISLRVRPEVSELSSQGAITVAGFQIPGVTVRRAETTIELGSGQSFMIAGLLSNSANNTIEKTPGAGDLPILGSLFRSTSFRKGETELVIVVTPYLVNPVDSREIKLPTDGFSAPDELQRILGNVENVGKSGTQRPGPTAKPADAPNPKVGTADPVALPAPRTARDERNDERKNGKANRNRRTAAAAAAPGFNLN